MKCPVCDLCCVPFNALAVFLKPLSPLESSVSADAKFFSLSFNSCVSMHKMAGNASMWATAPSLTAPRKETCGPS